MQRDVPAVTVRHDPLPSTRVFFDLALELPGEPPSSPRLGSIAVAVGPLEWHHLAPGLWLLDRSDFRDRFVHHGISITDGITDMAEIDWAAAINALDTGELPCSGGERRILRLAASLASGIAVDLRDAVTGLDHRNIDRLVNAILHASGQRQQRNRP